MMYTQSKQFNEVVVEVKHVSKHYSIAGREDKVKALNEIHLSEGSELLPVRRGEFVMLRGPSGGGKTTLLNLLGTIDRASEGVIELFKSPITSSSSDEYLAKLRLEKIGFVFQTFNLLATMSAFENVELPMIILGKLNAKERRKRSIELLTCMYL
ncbi:putative non-transporter ABC protein [Tieghemostelium lacteum]|uniref:Putative non-transporter ABC protein n=1 Tax=Tieghemostelium lacteum TaxID=361077 RepID=A0A151Z431_TIELA|nr:putative non-transporter ABC protein [Tieghemostelium lacteum]|eukprot:KYQ88719.1 putative non-transporter ABC protein [Tieghemostelium lacteum]